MSFQYRKFSDCQINPSFYRSLGCSRFVTDLFLPLSVRHYRLLPLEPDHDPTTRETEPSSRQQTPCSIHLTNMLGREVSNLDLGTMVNYGLLSSKKMENRISSTTFHCLLSV